MSVCVFIFRRDLRLHDNTAFLRAVELCERESLKMVPMFIFNEQQVDPRKNKYFCNNQVQFMVQSLKDLDGQLRRQEGAKGVLNVAHSKRIADEDVLEALVKKVKVHTIAFNTDVTPFARKRDEQLRKWCEGRGIHVLCCEDYTLLPINKVKTRQGKAYEVFTPFYQAVMRETVTPVAKPRAFNIECMEVNVGEQRDLDSYYKPNAAVSQVGGRQRALEIIKAIKAGKYEAYKTHRDYPTKKATTNLGGALKFGCVSIREVYEACVDALGKESTLVQQLIWREYYYNTAYHFPEVLQGQLGGGKMNTHVRGKFADTKWNDSAEDFDRWCRGQTGVPLVDAAMRCMNATGWMHNRLRMVVAMFLVRHLGIDWRKGEMYFAKHLVDYDAANNNGGWCWVQLYRHRLSPYVQAKRFDKDCEFIREWVPELRGVPNRDILNWDKRPANAYLRPMI